VRRRFALALCIFPFEEKFFAGGGVPVTFIGHPLVGEVHASLTKEQFCAAHGLDCSKPIVTILPGSRAAELRQHLPVLRDAIAKIYVSNPVQFIVAAAPGQAGAVQSGWPAGPTIRIVEGQTYDALAAADAAIVSSGTATVEAALLDTPMVVVYRVTPLTALLAKPLVRTRFFAMVNLIADRKAVPELIQGDFTAENVAKEVRRLLTQPRAREAIRGELAEIRRRLGPPGAVERAADAIAERLKSLSGNDS
jgi:lipid-A-disaccharide synthase